MTVDEFALQLVPHRSKLIQVAQRVVKLYEDAEDAVQNATIAMLKKVHLYNPAKSILNWACTFTHWYARNIYKSKGRLKHANTCSYDAITLDWSNIGGVDYEDSYILLMDLKREYRHQIKQREIVAI